MYVKMMLGQNQDSGIVNSQILYPNFIEIKHEELPVIRKKYSCQFVQLTFCNVNNINDRCYYKMENTRNSMSANKNHDYKLC